MRDEHTGGTIGLDLLAQQSQHLARGFRVEIARGLIRKHKTRSVHEGTRDRNPLQLASGMLSPRPSRPTPASMLVTRASASAPVMPSRDKGKATFRATVR